MAVSGWILDKSAAARASTPSIAEALEALADQLFICPVGVLERLYSARSAREYDQWEDALAVDFKHAAAPLDVVDRALALQRDLAHHHGLWHRTPIGDLLIAETALFHHLGVLHVDRDYDRIAEVRPLIARNLRAR